MNTAIQTNAAAANSAELALIAGDLSKLSAEARLDYYQRVCHSTGLNPFTKPFDYIMLNGKLTLYCRKDATDQLRKIHHVSITVTSRERIDDVYVVTARASLPDGRADESIGAVTIGTLKGDGLANALMKAETKAKRRATLSICGLGWLDETELSTIPDAQPVQVDVKTGEIIGQTRRIASSPPTNRVLTPDPGTRDRTAERLRATIKKAESLLPTLSPENRAALQAGIDAAAEIRINPRSTTDDLYQIGLTLASAIKAHEEELEAEMENESGSFIEVVENVELFPNGVPA